MTTSKLLRAAVDRRRFLVGTGALGLAAAFGLGRPRSLAAFAAESDWSAPVDISKAKIEAAEFVSYGMPDSWANYGEVLQKMAAKYGFTINHVDTDMSSLEEITKFDAEKNNPVAISADIGILFGPVADARGVVPPFMPPLAAKLPAGLKGKQGGWVATYTGVPAFVVNTDVVKNVPRSWDDLLKPEYKGLIGSIDAGGSGGTDLAVFIAWAYAHGGSETDLAPGAEFARKMLPQFSTAAKNAQTLERGEVPIQIKYDFNCIAAAAQVKAKGVNAEVVIPKGTIYAPSALMINRYNTAKMDAGKLLLDFVLSDEAQIAFAKFGARPIRWVLGDLDLPADAKAGWLPDAQYEGVHVIKNWADLDVAAIAGVWQEQVAGG
ncbi:extracellular solute-binding protein [Aureimonas ureilytica]|uniref:extracellular solute-binding protein n=1 Tax=Aureimonas ureilytica TaxID=401562 RepID=UPI0007342170|nr:extracellular solute-binding protein [Aureimonas ureilytica]